MADLDAPTLERCFRGHKNTVTATCFNPNMKQLASSANDGTILLWNFKQTRAIRLVGHKGPVTDCQYAPDGRLLASASRDRTVRIWTPNVRGDSEVFKAHGATIRSVCFNKTGDKICTASDDKTVKIWSVRGHRFQYSLVGHSNWVRKAVWSPDARLIASGSDDKTVKLWDAARSRDVVNTFHDHTAMVTDVAFHPDGTCVASCSADRTIKIWDVRTNQLLQHYNAHDDVVATIDFHPSGNYLISSSNDQTLKAWDLREGHLFYVLHGHDAATTTAKFSPDGAFFASGGIDCRVMVWQTNFDKKDNLLADGASANNLACHSRQVFESVLTANQSTLNQSYAPPPSAVTRPTTAPSTTQKSQPEKPRSSVPSARSAQPPPPTVTAVRAGTAEPVPAEQAPEIISTSTNEHVARTLQALVDQMEIMGNTISYLEARLADTEGRAERAENNSARVIQILTAQQQMQQGQEAESEALEENEVLGEGVAEEVEEFEADC